MVWVVSRKWGGFRFTIFLYTKKLCIGINFSWSGILVDEYNFSCYATVVYDVMFSSRRKIIHNAALLRALRFREQKSARSEIKVGKNFV